MTAPQFIVLQTLRASWSAMKPSALVARVSAEPAHRQPSTRDSSTVLEARRADRGALKALRTGAPCLRKLPRRGRAVIGTAPELLQAGFPKGPSANCPTGNSTC